MGVGCALLLIVGTIYSLLYNNGRWVKNMDMSEYVFSYKDIPMLVIGALIALYAIYIIIICFKNVFLKTAGKNDIQEQFLLTGDFVECLVFWGLADFGHTINLEKYFLLLFSYFLVFSVFSLKVNFLISQKMSFFKKINVRHNQKPTRQVLNYYLQLSGLWQQVCFPVMLNGVQCLC